MLTDGPTYTASPLIPGIKAGETETLVAGGVIIAEALPTDCGEEEFKGNSRLFPAAFNAFTSSAERLNLNAVELAERMQDGGIANLAAKLYQISTGRIVGERDSADTVQIMRDIASEALGILGLPILQSGDA